MMIWDRVPHPILHKRPDPVSRRPDDDDKTGSSSAGSRAKGTPANDAPGQGASAKGFVPQASNASRERRPPPDKRAPPSGRPQDASVLEPPPASDVLKPYPDADQLTERFLLLEENALAINLKPRDQLSIEDGLTLKEYDALRDRLAFLRADGATQDGGPVAMRRFVPAAPAEGAQTPPPAATPPRNDDGPQIRYVGGVRIKNDYSLKEVFGMGAEAVKRPFGSFIKSARDLVKKATQGVALSADEEQKIYQYAQIVESFLTLTHAGRVQQAAGSALETLNSALAGESLSPQTMTDNIGQLQGFGEGLAPTSAGVGWIVRKPPAPARTRATAPQAPPREPLSIFDFPRFRIPLGMRAGGRDAQPAFKPPARLPTGQIGYRLSPTRPPKLPAEGTQGAGAGKEAGSREEPVAGAAKDSGARKEPVAETAEEAGPREEPVAGASGGASGKTEEAALRHASSEPGRKVSEADPSCLSRSTGCVPTGAAPITIENAAIDRLAGKGPISVSAPLGPDEEQRRVNAFDTPFIFYRKDMDVTSMARGRRLQKTSSDMRRDVLKVGNGGDVTSYSGDAKFFVGRQWGPDGAKLAENINVIQLNNGRDGVGALRLRFADIPQGASVLVTGGPMSGCTMLFASDGHSLYAYHAGTSSPSANWHTSTDGARSIVKAHRTIGPRSTSDLRWQNNNLDLVEVGHQYPFSALIYSGRKLSNAEAVAGMGAIAGAVGVPELTALNTQLGIKRHEYGPRENRWHMMTFNYYEQNPQQPAVGTALAVVSRNMDGSVTLRVLAEKGHLDRRTSIGDRDDLISYRYTPVDSDSATLWLDKA
ncbi:cytotoxic necrotizing factor Rho-activating domain-containing protein [Paraburkholderia sp. 2C]